MSSDELKEQIEALRSEVRQLNDSFTSLRDEDIRRVFAQQVRSVLVERIDRGLGWPGVAASGRWRDALVEWLNETLEAFEQGGREEVFRALARRSARQAVRGADVPDVDMLADSLETQVRSYLDTYNLALSSSRKKGGRNGSLEELRPEEVEVALGPLSNAIRIGILQHLSQEDDSLASISRIKGLQKGHLQFHLRSLLEGRYIGYDKKSRLYSLSPRGRRALDGLTRLMAELER
ncbi:MAG: hypothetical protein SA339_07920 [Methanomassiliicoccus sp.]|nr:hypothetical protein [Methanomassiliicoccus sp.]